MKCYPVLTFVTCLRLAVPALAQDTALGLRQPSISVQGEAFARVVPDQLLLTLGVVSDGPAASNVMSANSKAVANVIEVLKTEGVRTEDIFTTRVALSPIEVTTNKSAPKILGYRVRNQLQIRLKLAGDPGALLTRLIEKGVNSIEQIIPGNTDDLEVHNKLRTEAAKDAQRQASVYASALGLKLGQVLTIEPSASVNDGFSLRSGVELKQGTPIPIELGDRELRESVRVTFLLQQ